jgi:hypothetical protein
MRRREFIVLLGGATATAPFAAHAQQSKPMRRVAALMPYAANDPEAQKRNAAFLQGLQQLGWTVGQNVQIAYRWSAGSEDDTRKYAADRAAILRDPNITAGQWGAIQSVSPSLAIEVSPINLIDPAAIDRAITVFARSPNGGLIATGSALTVARRDLIIALAARYRLPAVYYDRHYVAAGGLISYGSNTVEQFRLAATYVDCILKGEKPADLPVQRRPNTNSSSTSKPPRHSASRCRNRCLPAPTR